MKKTMGDRLAGIRAEQGLSQTVMAQRLGIAQSTLSQLEKGNAPFKSRLLARLGDEFDVSADWMLSGEGARSRNQRAKKNSLPLVRPGDRERYALAEDLNTLLKDLEHYSIPGFEDRGERIFTISDESMEPDFAPGDHVVCERAQELAQLEPETPVVVVTADDVLKGYVKKKEADSPYVYACDAGRRLDEQDLQEIWHIRARLTERLRHMISLDDVELDEDDDEQTERVKEVVERLRELLDKLSPA